MRVWIIRLVLVAASLAAIAGCDGALTGSLDLTIDGLPAGVVGSVTITGPLGYHRTVTSSQTITGLVVGVYNVTPAEVSVANADFAGSERFGAAAVVANALAGQTTDVDITYAYAGFTLPDADDDAINDSATFPIYELTEVRSTVGATEVVVELHFVAGQTDLTALHGYLELDVDRDPGTGGTWSLLFCEDVLPFGYEFLVNLDQLAGDVTDASLSLVGTAPITVTGSTVTVTLPLTLIGGDGRIHAAAVVGHEDGPTDCVPYGAAKPLAW